MDSEYFVAISKIFETEKLFPRATMEIFYKAFMGDFVEFSALYFSFCTTFLNLPVSWGMIGVSRENLTYSTLHAQVVESCKSYGRGSY